MKVQLTASAMPGGDALFAILKNRCYTQIHLMQYAVWLKLIQMHYKISGVVHGWSKILLSCSQKLKHISFILHKLAKIRLTGCF